jgi:two-component system NtrC family sensor kinase
MGLEAGEIFLVDDAAGEVVLVIHRGYDPAAFWERTRFRIGEGVPGMVAASGEPIIITDLARDARFLRSQVIETSFCFYASVPLKAMDRVVGTLGMAGHERHQFSEADMTLLSTVGSQLGGVIENARLFELVRESEQRFRGLIGTAQDAVVIMDHHGRITLVNHVAEKIFGYREKEMLGQPVTPLMPERYREAHRQGIERYLRTREASLIGRTIELGGLRRSGEEFPLEMSLSVMEHKGSPLFTAIIRDITERKKIEAELKSLTDELERKVEERTKALKETQVQLIQSGKLAALGTLAAGVAHELNQPLMVIRGYAQELLADERLADQELREDLRRIEGQTTRMVAIITHLRDFSRQSKGRREPTDLNHVVTQAFTFLAQQLTTRNIGVVQELDPALPTVWADPLQIEQIILNLVTNARDALEATGNGTITIYTGRTQDSRVALTITDTGPGIPPDLQERIFDPFFTTKEVGKGTGLGLSICHGILEEHGGELLVQSPVADGRGARFTIVMPLSLRDSAGRVRA